MTYGVSASRLARPLAIVAVALLTLLTAGPVLAHGERAQTANLRMRTVNWYDTEITPKTVAVGEQMIIRGRLQTSEHWPEHVPSVTGRVYLNVGAAGPKFIKVKSTINGQSVFQSTQLELGKHYEYEIVLKARTPGRYHLHPVLNVLDSGGLIGRGNWVEITGKLRFLNHSCRANGALSGFELIARKPINAGEEITIDYNSNGSR